MNKTERKNCDHVSRIIVTLPQPLVINYFEIRRRGPLSNGVEQKPMPCDMYLGTKSQQVAQSSLCMNSNDGKSSIWLYHTIKSQKKTF